MPKHPAPTSHNRAYARAALVDERFRAALLALTDLHELLADTASSEFHFDDLAQHTANVLMAGAEPREDSHGDPLPVLDLDGGGLLQSAALEACEALDVLLEHRDGGRFGRIAAA